MHIFRLYSCSNRVGSRVEIYWARWKLMLIFLWPGQRLSKELFWRRGLYVFFSTAGLHPGSWINRLLVSREKFHESSMRRFMWRKREVYRVIWWCFARVKCGSIMSGFQKCWDCRVDRQISGMCGRTRVTRIDPVTVFDAILTSRQTREKLQCLYENLMSNNLRKTAVLKNIRTVN